MVLLLVLNGKEYYDVGEKPALFILSTIVHSKHYVLIAMLQVH